MKLIKHLFKKHLLATIASLFVLIFVFTYLLPQSNPAKADTVTLAASSEGNYTAWTANTGTKVDAVASDNGETSYILASANNDRQSFVFSGAGLSAGSTITSVKVEVVARTTGDDDIKILAEKGAGPANRDQGPTIELTGSYATYSRTMTTNPFTGVAWTLAEVNAWTVRFGVTYDKDGGTASENRVTQISVIVDYTSPDVTAPTLTSFSSTTANGIYGPGSSVNITANYDESLGTPSTMSIILDTGAGLTLSSVSGTTLTGTYIVGTTGSGQNTSALDVGSIVTQSVRDTSDNIRVDITMPGTDINDTKTIIIDTTAPTAAIVVDDTALKAGETSLVTFTFNEAVTGFTNADLTIANGALTPVASGDGGITWTATLTPTASIEDSSNIITINKIGVIDIAGNAGVGTTDSNNYAIDTLAPTVASIVQMDSNPTNATSVDFAVTFSESVTGISTGDFDLTTAGVSGASITSVSDTSGSSVTVTVDTGSGNGTIRLDVPVTAAMPDIAGNALSDLPFTAGQTFDIDKTGLSVEIVALSLTNVAPIAVTVDFNEDVTGFTAGDITLSTGDVTSFTSVNDQEYTFDIDSPAEGLITITVVAGAAEDNLTNTNPETSLEITYDASDPNDPVDVVSTSHATPSLDDTISMSWTTATDNGLAGVDGYAYIFNTTSDSVCDEGKDLEEEATSVSSDSLSGGTYYFHICTVDNAGNWTSTVNAGPFTVAFDPEDLDQLFDLGLISVPEEEDPEDASSATFEAPVTIITDGITISIPAGITMTPTDGSMDINSLISASASVSNVPGTEVAGLQFGLSDESLTFTGGSVTITVSVGGAYNGQTLKVYESSVSDGGWVQVAACLVADDNCTFTISGASFFGIAQAAGGFAQYYSSPEEPLSISINDGAETTDNPNVTLRLTAGSNVEQMKISNSMDFAGASSENFNPDPSLSAAVGLLSNVNLPVKIIALIIVLLASALVYLSKEKIGRKKSYAILAAIALIIITVSSNVFGQYSRTQLKPWTLSEGDGIKTVYVQYFSAGGYSSAVLSDSITLASGLGGTLEEAVIEEELSVSAPEEVPAPEEQPATPETEVSGRPVNLPATIGRPGAQCALLITKVMSYGQNNDRGEVAKLQTFLREVIGFGDLPTTGYFGPITDKYVRLFQKMYMADILSKAGVSAPTGVVGRYTMNAVNYISCLKEETQ